MFRLNIVRPKDPTNNIYFLTKRPVQGHPTTSLKTKTCTELVTGEYTGQRVYKQENLHIINREG